VPIARKQPLWFDLREVCCACAPRHGSSASPHITLHHEDLYHPPLLMHAFVRTVLSFMSEWGGNSPNRKTPVSATASPAPASPSTPQPPPTNAASAPAFDNYESSSPISRPRSDSRASVRPLSMIQTYQPPMMEVSQDTLPELQRIFTFLNSHSNKLYQEGYFLKFHDTDSRTCLLLHLPQLV
jgi:hypothetical protein